MSKELTIETILDELKSQPQLHVALDWDDVIIDFIGGVCTGVSKESGYMLEEKDITSWTFADFLDPILGRPWWEWMRDRVHIWGHAEPIPGAILGIEKMRRMGIYTEIVTAKPEWATPQLWKWLGRYSVVVDQVTVVALNQTKSEVTDADILIDDRPSNCQEFVDAGGAAFLFSRTHNKDFQTSAAQPGFSKSGSWEQKIIRVSDWNQILSYLTAIQKES